MTQSRVSAIVLAAGYGKRMKSDIPKVLHLAAGRSLLGHVLGAVAPLAPERTIVVAPREFDAMKRAMDADGFTGLEYVVQADPKGTADATRIGLEALGDFDGTVLVLPGDHPLLQTATLEDLVARHIESGAAVTLLTGENPDREGFGRVIRGPAGELVKIVEERDATPEELKITEFNAGIYAFDALELVRALGKVDAENSQGEYYITDVIDVLRRDGRRVNGHVVLAADVIGVNSRAHLAKANKLVRRRVAMRLLDEGVTIVDPDSTHIDATVTVGRDAIIHPFTFIEGDCTVGDRVEIGPNCRIVDSAIGDDAVISFAVVRESEIGARVSVGPFASLRPGTKVADDVHIGTFVETKNSVIGSGTKVPHLSYIGDAEVGRGVNVGAGTITCNWDGQKKNKTVIDDDAYISSDTMLVAPVRVGKRAATGAGSVVREDVPDDALAVGVPARVLEGKGDRMKKGSPAPDANLDEPR